MYSKHNFKSLEDKKTGLQNLIQKIKTLDKKHLEYIKKIEDYILFYKIQNKLENKELFYITHNIDSDDIDDDNVDDIIFVLNQLLKIKSKCKSIFMEKSISLNNDIINSKQHNLDILSDIFNYDD